MCKSATSEKQTSDFCAEVLFRLDDTDSAIQQSKISNSARASRRVTLEGVKKTRSGPREPGPRLAPIPIASGSFNHMMKQYPKVLANAVLQYNESTDQGEQGGGVHENATMTREHIPTHHYEERTLARCPCLRACLDLPERTLQIGSLKKLFINFSDGSRAESETEPRLAARPVADLRRLPRLRKIILSTDSCLYSAYIYPYTKPR